jgi:endonuclease/exonuclease/phosphatase family metal-dependent hydrolase
MRILFWNIGYAAGLDGSIKEYTLKGHRIVRLSQQKQQYLLDQVAAVINAEAPDLALYNEISLGSGRNQKFNQHDYLRSKLANVVCESATSKYRQNLVGKMPLHVGNANGFLSWHPTKVHDLHLSVGKKTLVYVLEILGVTVIMVHLSLQRKLRKIQFQELAILVNVIKGPVVVCGDMNIFGGLEELTELQTLTKLVLPDEIPLTYPAFNPKLPLDLCLVRDCGKVTVKTLSSTVSDHAPILIELD